MTRIDALWEDVRGRQWFEGRWYYRPEETTCGRLVGHDDREIFETVHVDDNQVATIDGHCTVMAWDDYQRWLDTTDDELWSFFSDCGVGQACSSCDAQKTSGRPFKQ